MDMEKRNCPSVKLCHPLSNEQDNNSNIAPKLCFKTSMLQACEGKFVIYICTDSFGAKL